MTMTLPDWIEKVPGKENTFVIDPDKYYPTVLQQLGVDPDKADQAAMEIALGCMKLDFDTIIRLCGVKVPGVTVTRYIRGDGGRKARWARRGRPKGALDFDKLSAAERGRVIRRHYRRLRGR
jgi:hypothetical protein